MVIVEASGVATPTGIIDALGRYRGRPFTERQLVTIIDPTRLQVLLEILTPLAEAQITEADEIVFSKLDEARSQEIDLAEATARRLNPGARTWGIDASDQQRLEPLLAHLAKDAR